MIHPSAFGKLMTNCAFMMLSFSSQVTMSALDGNWRATEGLSRGFNAHTDIYEVRDRKLGWKGECLPWACPLQCMRRFLGGQESRVQGAFR